MLFWVTAVTNMSVVTKRRAWVVNPVTNKKRTDISMIIFSRIYENMKLTLWIFKHSKLNLCFPQSNEHSNFNFRHSPCGSLWIEFARLFWISISSIIIIIWNYYNGCPFCKVLSVKLVSSERSSINLIMQRLQSATWGAAVHYKIFTIFALLISGVLFIEPLYRLSP